MDGAQAGCNDTSHSDDFSIKGAALRKDKQPQNATSNGDICAICLEPISERAVATPCNHLSFDFLCLVSWLQEQRTCPLCKAAVREVQYDWRSPSDWKSYSVPEPRFAAEPSTAATWHSRRRNAAVRRQRLTSPPPVLNSDPALERRRAVYRNRTPSLHVGVNHISRHQDFTAAAFSQSSLLQSRARTFLRRELQVFTFLDQRSRIGSRDYLMEYIVAILRSNEVKGADGKAEELVGEFLGKENASLLLHELQAWLRSPWERLAQWDEVVQYREGVGKAEAE